MDLSDGVVEPNFRLLFESVPALYLVLTPHLRICAVSDAYLRATMTLREQIIGRSIFDVFPDNPQDLGATGVRHLRNSLEHVVRTGRSDTMAVQKYDIRRPESEGGGFEERFWSPRNSPVIGPDGQVQYIIHRVEDVTEFARLQRLGSEREKMTETLRSRAGQMEVEVFTRSQELGEANRQLRSLNDGMGRLYEEVAALMNDSSERTPSVGPQSSGQPPIQPPIQPEEMLARLEQLIRSRNDLEEQLRQGRKMEAVGRLAGGVAHDFNNLLTVIIGYADLARRELAGSPASESLKEIENAATRAAALTAQLLAFSRKQILQPRVIECNRVIAEMENLLRRVVPENVALITVLSSGTGRIRVDRTQLEQVILNLAVNARDAMPDGGRLTIETSSTRVAPAGSLRSLPEGEYALISVTDTGHGIDAATAKRVFEPFFTTKELGKGTGLGLATVHGIVEQSGGTVTLESSPGAGSTFRVYLPSFAGMESADETAPVVRNTPSLGAVLVVEDEPTLRKLVHSILTTAGYRVLEAANGEEALLLAKSRPVDLLLTDVVMPGISGPDLADRLRTLKSDLGVVFMSGYDRDLFTKTTVSNVTFLPKPFTAQALVSKVSESLRTHFDTTQGRLKRGG